MYSHTHTHTHTHTHSHMYIHILTYTMVSTPQAVIAGTSSTADIDQGLVTADDNLAHEFLAHELVPLHYHSLHQSACSTNSWRGLLIGASTPECLATVYIYSRSLLIL